jgi:hypothetical protein
MGGGSITHAQPVGGSKVWQVKGVAQYRAGVADASPASAPASAVGQHCDASVGASGTQRHPHGRVQSSQVNWAGTGQSAALCGEPATHWHPVGDDGRPQMRSCGCVQSSGR